MKRLFIVALLVTVCGFTSQDLFLTCVKSKKENIEGIVVSRIITQRDDGRKWIIIETLKGEEALFIEDLEQCPCSELKDISSYKNIDYIEQLMDR